MANRQWYYAISGSQAGPISEEELIRMFVSGQLEPDTLVWTGNMKSWAKASSIEGLVPPQGLTPPPSPPSPGTVGIPIGMQAATRTGETQYGGFWIRVVASIIDGVVMIIPVYLVSFLLRASMAASNQAELLAVQSTDSFVNVIMWWVYFAALHSSVWQASVGKKVLGLKVTDLEGRRISFGRASGRYFAGILSALLLCVGFMMVGWTRRKQGLHDKIAGTLVIKER